MCFLENVLHQSVDTLSKGYRHRTCFAQSIIHDPEVLILDEPTDGLDPNQKHEVRNLIRKMGEKKVIIFSTHILEEVDAVCTRAIIIDRGRVVANGTPDELRRKSENAGTVTVRVGGVPTETLKQRLSQLAEARRVTFGPVSNGAVEAYVAPRQNSSELSSSIASLCMTERWRLEELHTEEGRLDEVFRSITLPDTAKEVRR
jgi:ABC-2 type transport system ATP-binding protein